MKYFTIVGSKTLGLNSKYQVLVSSHGKDDKPEKLSIAIKRQGQQYENIQYREVQVGDNESKILEFDLREQATGDFFLEVKSIDGEHFEKRVNLNSNLKRFSVFVQTDKAIYKPSETVRFRILLLDINSRPYNASKVVIFITDGARNRVKQFLEPKFTKGVFQDELQLSDSPVMGDWKIHVAVDDAKEESKVFEVAEYVLPKFEAFIETKSHVLFSDGKIRAKVFGKYTYGKLARGKAKVTAKPSFGRHGGRDTVKVSQIIKVDGKADVEFGIQDDLEINHIDQEFDVVLEATFTEELTKRQHKTSKTVKVHKNAHKIEFVNLADKFKSGLGFTAEVLVKNFNGDPVSDDQNEVEFSAVFYHMAIEKHESFLHRNSTFQEWGNSTSYFDRPAEKVLEKVTEKVSLVHGKANLRLDIPQNASRMAIDAKYLEATTNMNSIKKSDSKNNQFIQAKTLSNSPSVGSELPIIVSATEELTSLTYVITGRNNVIESKTFKVSNTKNFDFMISPTSDMTPKADLVVFYLRSDGEIISDRIQINFGFKLQNFVKLELSSEQTKPGESIALTVNANPNSFVGLLGVDQSVLLQKTGNDIDMSSVLSDFEGYQSTKDEPSRLGYHHRVTGELSDFFEANAFVIINGEKEQSPMYMSGHAPMKNMGRMAQGNVFASFQSMSSVRQDTTSGQLFGSVSNSSAMKNSNDPPPPKIRRTFPETWIFDSLDMSTNKSLVTKKVPDTITSWIITGFAVDPETGLGFSEFPAKLNVFQPFFVSTNLPYSIKQGEAVAIPINVFNYLDRNLDVNVTLFNSDDEFEFENDEKMSSSYKIEKKTSVESNSGSATTFMIKPKKAGNIKIKVTATSDVAGDGLEQLLLVEPEGVTQFKNEAFLIDLRTAQAFNTKFSIEIPKNAVPDSTKIEVSAIGDILGPSIENLDKLIRIPYGCGEQNMLNFVPNIIVLEYLSVLQKLTPEIAIKAKKFMETGYQRELTYKHSDGSYSAFGRSDKNGSTWLTAFVAKSFHQAAKYIQIDVKIVKEALSYLAKTQQADGSFKELGKVFHKDMQGGSSKGLALTAYVLTTFLENQEELENYRTVVGNALNFIINNSSSLDDKYSLAIVAYALQVAKHPMKDSLMEKLNSAVQNENGLTFWTKSEAETGEKSCWSYQPNAINVEMTGYALQAYVEAELIIEGVSILKWLIGQRNKNGGFQSTQDTIVGLQAMSKLSAKVYVSDSQIDISVKHSENSEAKLRVNSENSLILQKYQLQANARNFDISATGQGFCVLQLSYKFNMSENSGGPSFILEPKLQDSENRNILNLTVASSYIANESSDKSNMAVMEVSFPSGFIFDSDHLETLKAHDKVQKVETKESETVVIVYFYDIDTNKVSLDFKAVRSHNVAQLKPASVLIYDYYDNARRAMTFYDAPES